MGVYKTAGKCSTETMQERFGPHDGSRQAAKEQRVRSYAHSSARPIVLS